MKRTPTKFFLSTLLLMSLSYCMMQAQVYDDHFGTGNNVGVTVTSSPTQGPDSSATTLDGTGYFPDLAGASRFLAQAGFGGSYEEMEYITQVGIEPWIEEQMSMPYTSYLDTYQSTYSDITDLIHTVHQGETIDRSRSYTDFVFWDKVFKDPVVLRNKAAFGLGQIFVVATTSTRLNNRGFGGADFHDVFYEGAFGNFRDLMMEVTMHPLMGYYLSHFQNRKGNPDLGTLPDENYAREIMQLFSIGLWELNNDGTCKLDAEGEKIPTYDIEDIQELAKVFTGFSGGAWNVIDFPNLAGQPLAFGFNINRYDLTVPMIIYEQQHESGEKIMIDGSVIPAGQSGMQDVNDAIDVLFNHPNVGPFIALRLIQQMVKSNPSPAYINRVATAFNNNGHGERGDMKAVFKAILTDPESRDCTWNDHPKTGKLRQPLERLANLCRAFDVDTPSGRIWMSDANTFFNIMEQTFMGAPSVFNFFSPFYAEDNYVAPNDMVSPEFQILHSVTAVHYLNLMEDALTDKPFRNFTRVNTNNPRLANNNQDAPFLDFSDEIALLDAEGVSALLDRLNLIMCHGELSDGSKAIIEDAITQYINEGGFDSEAAVKTALYFIVASADFTILK